MAGRGLKLETLNTTLDSQADNDKNGWVIPSPMPTLDSNKRKMREVAILSRSLELGASLVRISTDYNDEEFQDLLDEVSDLSLSTEDKHKHPRGVQPPQEFYISNLLTLQKDLNGNNDNASFMDVLRTAYIADSSSTSSSNTFRINLVSKGMKNIHSFEFNSETEYWRFLMGVRKGNRGEMDNYVTGNCRVIGRNNDDEARDQKKTLGINMSRFTKFTGGNSGADAAHLSGQGKFVIKHNILSVRIIGPKGQLLDDEDMINLLEIWTLALTSDFTKVSSHCVIVQSELPDVVLKKSHNLKDFEIELVNHETGRPLLGKLQHMPITVYPTLSKSTLCAIAPTSYHDFLDFVCRDGRLQDIAVKVVDKAHSVEIGQQVFNTFNMVSEYKAIEPATTSSASNAATTSNNNTIPFGPSGQYSPKPKRSSLSAVRYPSSTDFFDGNPSNNNRSSFDLNRTSLTKNSTINQPIARLRSQQRVETQLLSKGGERVLKLEVKRAEGLLVAGKTPTVYCTIYLAGKNGQRFSSNVADMRTEAIKGLEPEWNHEIFIRDERLAREEVEFVMVLLRDSSSGLLKHKHIGQVMIPLSCFLETPATFCLPIEPSYRMDSNLSQTAYIGDIHLITQSVRGEALAPPPNTNGSNAQPHTPVFRVDSMRSMTFPTTLVFYRTSAGASWWPVKILHPVTATSSTGSPTVPSQSPSASANSGLSVNVGGSTINTPTFFSGFLFTASEALILALTNPLEYHYVPTVRESGTSGHLEVIWSDVLDCEVLSESAVYLTIQVPKTTGEIPHAAAATAASAGGDGVPTDKKTIDILVGPCPARQLVRVLQRRKRYADLSRNIAAINQFRAVHVPQTPVSSLSGPSSPSNPAMSSSGNVAGRPRMSSTRSSFFSGTNTVPRYSRGSTIVNMPLGVVETIRDAADVAEAIFKDLHHNMCSEDSNLSPQDVLWEKSLIRMTLCYLRCKVVPQLLPYIPPGEEVPEFTIAYIQRVVEKDKGFYQMLTPWRVNEKMESLTERYDAFTEELGRRVRDFVLFSCVVWEDQHRYSTPSAFGGMHHVPEIVYDEDIPKEARFCIEVLTEKYHKVIKQSLRPYIQSKTVFQSIQGQWLKNCVLKLLIEKNHQLEMVVALSLRLNGLYMQHKSLEMAENLEEILSWFASSLLMDTRLWLSKTLQQATTKRENTFDLPWDVEMVGDCITSHLPESVSFQLKVFMDVCVKDFNRSKRLIEASEQEAKERMGRPSAVNSVANDGSKKAVDDMADISTNLFDEGSEEALEIAKINFYKVANEKLLQAIAQAWYLLANEYERSLVSKHWDQVKPKQEQDAYVEFLGAVANDCHRIRRDQLHALKDIRANYDKRQEILEGLHAAFRGLIFQSVTYMTRIVFSTVQRSLIDFEDLWFNPSEEHQCSSITRVVVGNLRTWMLRIKNKLEYRVYRDLLTSCVEVLVLRFFILFRELLAQKGGAPLRTEDVAKLKVDIGIITATLGDLYDHDGWSEGDEGAEEPSSKDALKFTIGGDGHETNNGYWMNAVKNPGTSAHKTNTPGGVGGGRGTIKSIAESVKEVLLFFQHMITLIGDSIDSVSFVTSMTWLLQDYERIYHTNHPPYFVEFLLVHCILPLRPHTATETDSFMTAYHQQQLLAPRLEHSQQTQSQLVTPSGGKSLHSGVSGKGSSSHAINTTSNNNNTTSAVNGQNKNKKGSKKNLDQHDLLWRIFGMMNKVFDEIAESYEAAGGVPTVGGHFKFLAPGATKRFGILSKGENTPTPPLASVPEGGEGGNGKGGALMRFKNVLPLPKAPGDIFKPLREKAADFRVFRAQRRQNEEILAILRLLGLEGSLGEDANSNTANQETDEAGEGDGKRTGDGDEPDNRRMSRNIKGGLGLFSTLVRERSQQEFGSGSGLAGLDSPSVKDGNKPLTFIERVTGGGSSANIIPHNAHGSTYSGFIKISHIEVRKLNSAALFGECHPYIYFTMGQQRAKSSVKPKCHAATWDELVTLKVPTKLDLSTAVLQIEVFDKELIRRKRLLGEVSIKLDGLDLRDFDSWFALEGGECAGVGEIHVKLTLQKLNNV